MSSFEYLYEGPIISAGERLWNIIQKRRNPERLYWAFERKNSIDIGERANALYILHTNYKYGWTVEENETLSNEYLKQAADLGHAQACYDVARTFFETSNFNQALLYVNIGLEKIEDFSFDCEENDYIQKSLEKRLQTLSTSCKSRIPSF